jgi:hypothetical protein
LRDRRWERIALVALFGAAGLYGEWMGPGGFDAVAHTPELAKHAWLREIQGAGRSLPLLMCAALLAILWKGRQDYWHGRQSVALPLLWCVFALGMLAKLGLHAHLWHYGVFLAMPAFAGSVWLVLWWLPQSMTRLAGHAAEFRAPLLCFLVFGLLRLGIQSQVYFLDKTFEVASGADRILAAHGQEDQRTEPIADALAWINQNIPAERTLGVLPEGAMLNYLTRRTNPTPYLVFMAEMDAFGEDAMLAAYQKSPPDYIALVQRDTDEYGPGWWGERKGFGRDTMAWVRRAYEPVHLIGKQPFASGEFGIQFLRRKP